jgi:hypothetical protein
MTRDQMRQHYLDAIAKQGADEFVEQSSDGFNNVDVRGFPGFLKPQTGDPSFVDDEFGGLVDESKHSIRGALARLANDEDVMRDLSCYDRAALEELESRELDRATAEFIRRNPAYYKTEENARILEHLIEENFGDEYTVANLEAAFKYAQEKGMLEVEPGSISPLSDEELLKVCRLAASGDLEDAVVHYLEYSVPGVSVEDILQSPRYAGVVNRAAYTVWEQIEHSYEPSPEWDEFAARRFGKRPLTVAGLRQAWKDFSLARTTERLRRPVGLVQNVDDLTDEQIANQLARVRRERAGN